MDGGRPCRPGPAWLRPGHGHGENAHDDQRRDRESDHAALPSQEFPLGALSRAPPVAFTLSCRMTRTRLAYCAGGPSGATQTGGRASFREPRATYAMRMLARCMIRMVSR